MISVERLTKWYGPRLAVDGVSFDVSAGEVMGLLGPNGSGKTTILRILTGYLRPTSGTVSVAGIGVLDDPLAARRLIGYVPEDAPLYDGLRVSEFLLFMAKLKGMTEGAAAEAVAMTSEKLGLGPVRDLLIGKLSRGFRQRVAVAQALLNRPPVLVLDEPTNGLDPQQIVEMRDLIQSLAGSHTVLVTSHILSEMARVADQVVILLEGRVLATQALRDGGMRRFRLRARGDRSALLACLAAVPGVAAVTPEPDGDPDVVTFSVEVDGGPRAAEDLAWTLFHAGFPISELTETGVDLEQLFLGLTRRRQEANR